MTRPAYLLAHVLRAVPVSMIHHWCYLKQKLAALRLMDFKDCGAGMRKALIPAPAIEAETSRTPWGVSPLIQQFHLLRVALLMIDDYLEGALLLDRSLVVRNLRSRRFTRQLLGWLARLTSRTILDTFLLSVVTPILLASADHYPNVFANLRPTIPGLLRGLGCGCAGVLLQWMFIPLASQMVNRGVVTVYEGVEYLILRRYAMRLNNPEENNFDDDDDDDDDGGEEEVEHSRMASVVSYPESDAEPRKDGERAARDRAESGGGGKRARGESERTAEDVLRRLRREIRKEMEEVQRRRARRARRVAEARHAILRAIFYRISGALVAQCVVEHPLNVVVELLRGRAMMHVCGLLNYYDDARELEGLNWAGAVRFCQKLAAPAAPGEGEGIPHWLQLLRGVGSVVGVEIRTLTESVQAASGQLGAIRRLRRSASDAIREGGRPSAWQSAELMARWMLSFTPLYYDVQLTAVEKLLGFYMAIWTRLTKT
ncbi:unnamed protein product [Phytomonas sp. Hart1]|nr:unnamed protein product [Phytomonas sp. Hart1]|eukprot:CCW71928.1 unnamed protein product [Phytomonas sp. isolate Hart1]